AVEESTGKSKPGIWDRDTVESLMFWAVTGAVSSTPCWLVSLSCKEPPAVMAWYSIAVASLLLLVLKKPLPPADIARLLVTTVTGAWADPTFPPATREVLVVAVMVVPAACEMSPRLVSVTPPWLDEIAPVVSDAFVFMRTEVPLAFTVPLIVSRFTL